MTYLLLCQLILLHDVASRTFLRNSERSSANLPACVLVVPSHSSMSCSHLLADLPLPLRPFIFASRICFLCDLCRFMCPKYTSFSLWMFCKSVGVLIPILERTVSSAIYSVHDILKSFLMTYLSCYFNIAK